jgi:hypothetical protein
VKFLGTGEAINLDRDDDWIEACRDLHDHCCEVCGMPAQQVHHRLPKSNFKVAGRPRMYWAWISTTWTGLVWLNRNANLCYICWECHQTHDNAMGKTYSVEPGYLDAAKANARDLMTVNPRFARALPELLCA